MILEALRVLRNPKLTCSLVGSDLKSLVFPFILVCHKKDGIKKSWLSFVVLGWSTGMFEMIT